jgi:hypothetical protein
VRGIDNAVNGVPSCANYDAMTVIARESWGFQGYVCCALVEVGGWMRVEWGLDGVACLCLIGLWGSPASVSPDHLGLRRGYGQHGRQGR